MGYNRMKLWNTRLVYTEGFSITGNIVTMSLGDFKLESLILFIQRVAVSWPDLRRIYRIVHKSQNSKGFEILRHDNIYKLQEQDQLQIFSRLITRERLGPVVSKLSRYELVSTAGRKKSPPLTQISSGMLEKKKDKEKITKTYTSFIIDLCLDEHAIKK